MSYFNGNYSSQAGGQFANFDRCVSHRSDISNYSQRNMAEDDLEVSKLKREINDLDCQEYDCESVQKETKQLEGLIQSLTEKIVEQNAEARTERESMLLKIAKAQAEVKTQRRKLERIEADYRKYVFENADAQMMMKNRQLRANHTNDVLRDATITYQNVKGDFARVRSESQIILQDKEHIKAQIEEFEDDLDKKLSEFKLIKERIAQLQSQLATFESVSNQMKAENNGLAQQERDLQKSLDEADHHIFALMAQLTNSMDEVEQLKNETFVLRSDIVSIEGKIAKKHEAIRENELNLAKLNETVQDEQLSIQQKASFISDLKEKELEKQEQIAEKKSDIEAFKAKTELLKRFSDKAFEELARYVKLDKTVSAIFVRGYQPVVGDFSKSQIHSEVKLY